MLPLPLFLVWGVQDVVVMVVKANVGELEEEIREDFSRMLRKEMPGIVKEDVGKRNYLLSF